MHHRIKTKAREYDLSADAEEADTAVFIDGYKVEFDQKVTTTPVEVVAIAPAAGKQAEEGHGQ